MCLRQLWNWFLKFGCNVEETNETTQQILCRDSSAVLVYDQAQGLASQKRDTSS